MPSEVRAPSDGRAHCLVIEKAPLFGDAAQLAYVPSIVTTLTPVVTTDAVMVIKQGLAPMGVSTSEIFGPNIVPDNVPFTNDERPVYDIIHVPDSVSDGSAKVNVTVP